MSSTKDKPVLDDCSRVFFAELYREHPVLWDRNHDQYKNYAIRQKAYETIAEKMQIPGLTAEKVVKNIHNMRSTYVKLKKQGKLADEQKLNCKDWVLIMDSFKGDLEPLADENLCATPKDTTHFSNSTRMQLLTCYRGHTVLWWPQHPHYRHTYHREQAWEACANRVGIPSDQCRKQINNMRTAYVKKRKLQATGPFSTDTNSNIWLTAMDAFLGPVLFEPEAVDVPSLTFDDVIEETQEPDILYKTEEYLEEVEPDPSYIVEYASQSPEMVEESVIEDVTSVAEFSTCRCCLQEFDTTDLKLMDRSFRDGIVYVQIYKDCIGYNHDDSHQRLAPTICRTCEKTLLDVYEFRKQCRNNEDTYLATLSTTLSVKDEDVVDLKIECLDNEVVESMQTEEEEIAENVEAEEMFVEKDVSPPPKSFVCQVCGKSFKSEHFLDIHVSCLHAVKPQRVANKPTVDTEGRQETVACVHCQQVFKAERYLKRHRQFSCSQNPNFDRSKLPVCPICGKQVTRLSVHLKTHRTPTDKERFQCTLCERTYKSKIYLDGHMKISHKNHSYKCQFCDAEFKSWNGKRNHIRQKHLGVRPYLCDADGCDRRFLQTSQLNYHKRQAHNFGGAQSFECDICQLKFSKKETLKVHRESKHLGQSVTCTVCNKKFACKKLLQSHAVLHTGEKNYKCPLCDPPVAFAQNHLLRSHCAKVHPTYTLPPKGTVMSAKALERRARQEELDKTLVKISLADYAYKT